MEGVYGVVLSENPNVGVDEEWDRVGRAVACYAVGVDAGLVGFVSENRHDVWK